MDDQLKRQLQRFKAEQKVKSQKDDLLKNFYANNSARFQYAYR